MTASQTPNLRFEDRKILKLLERIEKQKSQTKHPVAVPSHPKTLAS